MKVLKCDWPECQEIGNGPLWRTVSDIARWEFAFTAIPFAGTFISAVAAEEGTFLELCPKHAAILFERKKAKIEAGKP